jgi:S1-C subfamily serine protease
MSRLFQKILAQAQEITDALRELRRDRRAEERETPAPPSAPTPNLSLEEAPQPAKAERAETDDEAGRKLLGLTVDENAVVLEVLPNSPAAESGIRPGDTITTVNGQPVRSGADLRRIVGAADPDQEVTLEVLHAPETAPAAAAGEEGR